MNNNLLKGHEPTQFGSGQDPTKGGRKKKIYTILKEKGFGAEDIKAAFGEMAFYTVPELKEVYDDDSKPVIARIVANQFYQALKKSDWTKIKEILEHVVGKPDQRTSHNVEGSPFNTIENIFKDFGQSKDNPK